MLRSMYSGISGMRNFQTKLDVIGNNIANVNTYGFKKGRVTFKDTMNQTISGATASTDNRGGQNPMQVGLGATIATIDTIHTQSSLQTTGRSLDLAIDGDGYFIVNQGDAQFYTRAGNFYLDDNGTLVTGEGFKVQAYDETGTLGDVAVNVNAVSPAVQTEEIVFSGNLSSTAAQDFVYNQQIKVIDDVGIAHTVDVYFKKTATADEWDVYINQDPDDPASAKLDTITFDSTTGEFDSADTGDPWEFDHDGDGTSGTATIDIDLDFSALTQFDDSTTALANPDGNTEGVLESFNIGAGGEINGVYSNGLVNPLGTLAIAKFSNPAGLTKSGNNLFQESINSGTANVDMPGEGRGLIASGRLEMSNVDLSEEFTEMIVAQRGFQANTRIITTSDEILQELVNLKR
ncbi:flagellar basal-body rod protein FlgF [Cytobacillus sp. IB215665]|uniref:flagellar basal-body rod protein FlgF n=1 Tax=Cytobacillus sp. IB215665 TaxID=3097357 RepID=UPI002A0DC70B|nr:flagellar basal-body rod protein FlgF [Cytobacillus sp. IB215665]MDX8365070.1 flagellar basal-body rod protein FlgF [Cytobacillus sp. IB215665]